MGNEIRIPEMEVPQLRQMVLKNTKRIIKNEQTIREMKEKLQKEGLRQLQRETYWDTSREEHDRAHREHEQDISILKYGFKIRQETVNETVVHDALPNVLDRVKTDLEARDDPYSALLVGVDEPWEVCLLTLLFGMARRSAPGNARELRADPDGSRHEIEAAFRLAARDKSSLSSLASLLRRRGPYSVHGSEA